MLHMKKKTCFMLHLNNKDTNQPGLWCRLINTYTERIKFSNFYTPGIYAEGYIVFVFPFVRSYVCMFVRSFVRWFVRSYFLPSRGICVKVLR